MRYVSFSRPSGGSAFGRVENDSVVELGADGLTLAQALSGSDMSGLPERRSYRLADLALLPVIPDARKVLCVGLNYATHVQETEREQRDHPAIFTRWMDSLVAHGDRIVRPRESRRFDYEGELAVIIGKPARRVRREDALDHVAGYSIFQDGSIRDWQRHNIQFTPGKNFPATGSLGPALVTPDEVEDLPSHHVITRLNGAVVQDQAIADMIWNVSEVIAYCSTFTRLMPGDVIATGTPGGVGDKRQPPLYLKSGDVVDVEIGSIGKLVNSVVDEDELGEGL